MPPIYDRAALKLTDEQKAAYEAEGRKPHWRFKLEGKRVSWEDLARGHAEVDTASMSDPVLIRADGLFLYTLPSVVDDIDMEITHIIRGEDHVTNTGAQIEIFEALGAKVPGFAHMPLLVGADGSALSKRLGSLAIMDVAGSMQELGEGFSFSKMGRSPARYDEADLGRLNAQALQVMSYETAKPRLAELGVDLGEAFWNVVRPNLNFFKDVQGLAAIINGPIAPVIEDTAFAEAALKLLPAEINADVWSVWTGAVKAETGAKGKGLFMPLRLALTGQPHGPDMGAIVPMIPRERIVARLKGETA